MGAQYYDGNLSIPGCDKNMPGVIMAMARCVLGAGKRELEKGRERERRAERGMERGVNGRMNRKRFSYGYCFHRDSSFLIFYSTFHIHLSSFLCPLTSDLVPSPRLSPLLPPSPPLSASPADTIAPP